MLVRALQKYQFAIISLFLGAMIMVGFPGVIPENSHVLRNPISDIPLSQMAVSSLSDLYQAGIIAYRKGDYPKAAIHMQQVLEQQPNAVNAHYYLAVSQDLMGHAADALPHYQWVSQVSNEPRVKTYANKRLAFLQKGLSKGILPPPSLSLAGLYQSPVAAIANKNKATAGIVPLKHSKNALMVDAVLTNAKTGKRVVGTFILDTGATYTSISEEMAESLGLDTENGDKVRITTANGRIDVAKVVIDTVQMEGVAAHQVSATVIQVRPDSSFSGLLGLSFIRQFKMTIDPVANQLVFEPNPENHNFNR